MAWKREEASALFDDWDMIGKGVVGTDEDMMKTIYESKS